MRTQPVTGAPGRRTLFGQLLAWSLGALALLWLGFVAAGWQSGRHEADELVDGQLASAAALLAALDGDMRWATPDGADVAAARPPHHPYQHDYSLVVWDAHGQVLAHQGEAPLPPFDRGEGFATLPLGEPARPWRCFARWTDGPAQRRVMVLVDVADRNTLGWDIAGQVAAPGLWLLPALALVLGLALRRGLRPLHALPADLQALGVGRNAGLLPAPSEAEFGALARAVNALVLRYQAALAREQALGDALAGALTDALTSAQSGTCTGAPAGAPGPAPRSGAAAQPLDLAALAQQLLGDRVAAAQAGGHRLELVGAGQPFPVDGHPALLGLALGTLVDDALAAAGGPQQVELRLDAGARRAVVCGGPLLQAAGMDSRAGTVAADAVADADAGPGRRLAARVAGLHSARFGVLPAPPGFRHAQALQFGPVTRPANGAQDGPPAAPATGPVSLPAP